VLVVDDDGATREVLTLILEAAGYEVSCAANGREALDRLRRGARPGLILLDLMMPVLDGWGFRREQQRDPALASIPVVVVSAEADLRRRADSLAVAAYLEKPVEIDRLLETVRGLGGGRQPGILVAEDEDLVRQLLHRALEQEGFTVWSAGDGREAVELFRRHGAGIALVLLDVQMPALDGPGTLAALRGMNPGVCCCFMSGDNRDYDGEALRALGVAGFFQKPFALAEVTQALRRLAGGGSEPVLSGAEIYR